MKLLLDTHIMLWAMTDDEQLPAEAREMIQQKENDIYFSMISLWEIQIKHLLHPEQTDDAETVLKYCQEAGFKRIPFDENSIYKLSNLKRPDSAPRHKDPFDRILICQALAENMIFLTHDSLLTYYNVPNVRFV